MAQFHKLPSLPLATYLVLENGAEETSFVDLLTGRQHHFHLFMVAQSARVVEVYSTQCLNTLKIVKKIKMKERTTQYSKTNATRQKE